MHPFVRNFHLIHRYSTTLAATPDRQSDLGIGFGLAGAIRTATDNSAYRSASTAKWTARLAFLISLSSSVAQGAEIAVYLFDGSLQGWITALGQAIFPTQQPACSRQRTIHSDPVNVPFAASRRTVYLTFDADTNGSGQRAAQALAERLRQQGVTALRVSLPDGHDPNSFFVQGGDAQQFQSLLEAAQP
jgi:hypothetical protein